MNPPTLQDLQGDWKIVTVGQNGGKAPFFIPWLLKPRLRVDGERYTKFMGEKKIEQGRLAITAAGEFAFMDEYIETGDEAGKHHLGIVRWVGKKLEHLQAKIGDERPEAFPYHKESKVGYAMMKRAR